MNKLIRNIPDDVAKVLQEQAEAKGLTLTAYIRLKLIELAGKDTTMDNEQMRAQTLEVTQLSERHPQSNPGPQSWGGSQDGTEMVTFQQENGYYGYLRGVYQGNFFEGDDQGPYETREEAEAYLREDYAESQRPQPDIYPSEDE